MNRVDVARGALAITIGAGAYLAAPNMIGEIEERIPERATDIASDAIAALLPVPVLPRQPVADELTGGRADYACLNGPVSESGLCPESRLSSTAESLEPNSTVLWLGAGAIVLVGSLAAREGYQMYQDYRRQNEQD